MSPLKLLKLLLPFVVIVAFQVLVLNRIDLSFGEFNYIHVLLYPYLILVLPFQFNKYATLCYAFVLGLIIDVLSGTMGIHASATVLIAYLQPVIQQVFEPREGFVSGDAPSVRKQGLSWVFVQVSILVFIHHLFLFSVEAFSFVYLFEIILRTIFSFMVSTIIIMLTFILFNPKY
jgi:hypothetical protein